MKTKPTRNIHPQTRAAQERREKIQHLRGLGWTYRSIAAQFNLTVNCVWSHCKEVEFRPRPARIFADLIKTPNGGTAAHYVLQPPPTHRPISSAYRLQKNADGVLHKIYPGQ